MMVNETGTSLTVLTGRKRVRLKTGDLPWSIGVARVMSWTGLTYTDVPLLD